MNFSWITLTSFLLSLFFSASSLHGQEPQRPLFFTENLYKVAQASEDDSYDPFADYSEFDEASQEEADVNFFRNGRLLNVGFLAGLRTFTSNMGKIYKTGSSYGLFLSYFFDLRFALQTSYRTGSHPFSVSGNGGSLSGNTSITTTAFNLKYYFNTQNVTRGLADLNPYVIGGFSQYKRLFSVVGQDYTPEDGSTSIDIGAGLEVPMLRNKMYFGIEAAFHLVNFPDESSALPVQNGDGETVSSGVKPDGDVLSILGLLGVNF